MPSAISAVNICNVALGRVGSTQVITALTDTSNEAVQCNVYYSFCRDQLLREFPWPFALTFAVLVPVSPAGQMANAEWTYAYRYPTDCMFLLRVEPTPSVLPNLVTPPLTSQPQTVTPIYPNTSLRPDGDPFPAPFEIGHDVNGRLILTDLPQASARYTAAVTDETQWPPTFASLLAWRIAMEIARSLAVDDKIAKSCESRYVNEMNTVRARSLNESQSDQPFMQYQSEFIRARFGI